MRVSAKKVLAQHNNNVVKVQDEIRHTPGRVSKLADLEDQAIEFANEVLLDIELPGNPDFTLGPTRGFEDLNVDINRTSGVITVYASFNTLSGYKVRMEMPIPVCRGNLYKPSVVVVNGKKKVFSQAALDAIVEKTERTRPRAENVMQPSLKVYHDEVMEKGLFEAPQTDKLWWEHVWERL